MTKRSAIAAACAAVLAVAVLLPVGLGGLPHPESALPDRTSAETGVLIDVPAEADAPEPDPSEAAASPESTVDPPSPSSEPEYVPDVVLVEIADGVPLDQVNERLEALDCIETAAISEDDLVFGYARLDLAAGVNVEDAVFQLQLEDFTSAVQPDHIYHLLDDYAPGSEVESDAPVVSPDLQLGASSDLTTQATSINDTYSKQDAADASKRWMLTAINAYQAWDYVSGRSNHRVTVAVLDSGINVNHEDLSGNITGAHSIVNSSDAENVTDVNGHGTHVAGIVAARANNSLGVAGVSYNAYVMPVQVIRSNGDVYESDAIKGIDYVIKHKDDNPNAPVRVANMSFGGCVARDVAAADGYSVGDESAEAFLAALNALQEADILVVCAAGNYANTSDHKAKSSSNSYIDDTAYKCFPCDFDAEVLGVINLDHDGSNYYRATGSNFNMGNQRTKELSAPGTGIYSTLMGGGYGKKSGTSMAAPCVAGVAAMLFAANPDLTAGQVKQTLINTAQDLNTSANLSRTSKFDYATGYGLVDAAAALKAVGAVAPTISGTTSVGVNGTTQLSVANSSGTWTWSSDAASIVAVNPSSGVVTGASTGTAVITAISGDITISQAVSVYDPAIQGDSAVSIGSTTQLAVSSSNPSGTWRWTTSDSSVVQILDSASGVIYGRGLGAATVTVSLSSNPSISATLEVTVGSSDVANATIVGVSDCVYTGSAVTFPNMEVRLYSTVGGVMGYTVLKPGTDYAVSYKDNVNVGDATVTITGAGDYEGTLAKTFRIGAHSLSEASVKVINQSSVTYTGSAIEPGVTIVIDGATLQESTDGGKTGDYTVTYRNNVNCGTASIVVTGVNNYVGTVSGSFSINAASVSSSSVSLTGVVAKTYTSSAITQSPVMRYNGKTLVLDTDYTVAYFNNTNAGTATMRVTGKGNFSGSRTATFAINPAPITGVTLSQTSYAYDGKAKTPSVTVRWSGGIVPASGYTVSYSNNTAPGTATAKVAGKGNFTGEKSAAYSIANTAAAPSAAGATSVPVGATAAYAVTNGSIAIKSGGACATLSGNTLTGKAAGTVVLSVRDKWGFERSTKTVSVYALSGSYSIRSALDGGKALDIAGGSLYNGGNAQIYQWNNTGAQKYEFSLQSDGCFKISSSRTGKALDVSGGSTANGANVQQYAWNGTNAQRWRMTVDASNRITFVNKGSGKVLDVSGGSRNNGANVQQYASNSTNAQKWTLSSASHSRGIVFDGVYRLTSRVGGSFALDVSGASQSNGANVQIWSSNGTAAQQWKLEYQGNGYYKATCAASGKVLDVSGGSRNNGANVQQYAWNGTNAQLWQLQANSDGSYTLVNKGSGRVLDVSGASARNGANVWQYTSNSTKAQKWTLSQY